MPTLAIGDASDSMASLPSSAVANRCLESIRFTPLSFTASGEDVEARSLLASHIPGARFVSSCVAAHGGRGASAALHFAAGDLFCCYFPRHHVGGQVSVSASLKTSLPHVSPFYPAERPMQRRDVAFTRRRGCVKHDSAPVSPAAGVDNNRDSNTAHANYLRPRGTGIDKHRFSVMVLMTKRSGFDGCTL